MHTKVYQIAIALANRADTTISDVSAIVFPVLDASHFWLSHGNNKRELKPLHTIERNYLAASLM